VKSSIGRFRPTIVTPNLLRKDETVSVFPTAFDDGTGLYDRDASTNSMQSIILLLTR